MKIRHATENDIEDKNKKSIENTLKYIYAFASCTKRLCE